MTRAQPRGRRVAVVAVVAALGCHGGAATPPVPDAAPAAATSAPTPWVPARVAAEASLLEMPAQVLISADATGAVAPPFSARIVRVHVRAGQAVDKGAPIVDVVMPQLVAAAGSYVAARTRVDAYGKRKQQLEALKKEGLARVAELADVDTKLAEARADQQAALATLRIAGVGPGDAARVLDATGAVPLRSPIAGVVVELNAAIGETREPTGRPIARIAGATTPRIEARLTHVLPAGARFAFVTTAGKRVPVRFVSQAPVVDSRDGTRAAWFEPTDGSPLPGGTSGRLRVELPPAAGALLVPATAVGHDDAGAFVVRRAGARQERVRVEELGASGADALVRGTLAPGDQVAADVARLDGAGT